MYLWDEFVLISSLNVMTKVIKWRSSRPTAAVYRRVFLLRVSKLDRANCIRCLVGIRRC